MAARVVTEDQMAEMVEGVKAHAMANYETHGWDVLVESMEDEEIVELIVEARSKSLPGAITACRKVMKAIKAYGDEIRATAF